MSYKNKFRGTWQSKQKQRCSESGIQVSKQRRIQVSAVGEEEEEEEEEKGISMWTGTQ